MVELTQRQENKVLTFANKAFSKISEIADNAYAETNKRKQREIVRSGIKLAKYLIAIDDGRNQWESQKLMLIIDNLINEYDLFEVPFNPSQLNINDLTTRILGDTGGDESGNVTTSQLNAEAQARISADGTLQDNINTVDQRITDLDFSGLVPATVVFSEAIPGFRDFPTELDANLPNKSVLDSISQQNLTDLDLNTAHRGDGNIHVTLSQKNDWDTRVTPSELSTALSAKANLNHTHTIGQVQGLQTELNILAQDIIDNAAEDGVTPNISIGSVTSGSTPSVTLAAGSTTANPILDFVLKPGEKGEKGDPFSFGAIDFLANRINFIGEDLGFSFVDVQTGFVYYKLAGPGVNSWSGAIRTIGDKGWTPIFALEADSGNVYQKLVGYIGGQGVAPTDFIGFYVGTTGYVESKLAAVNLKGNKGDSPVAGVDYDIPRFKIDDELTYQQYLNDSASLLSSQPIGYTIYIEGSVSPNENKNGVIIIISRNSSTGAREWKEYQFKGDQGPAGVPGATAEDAKFLKTDVTSTTDLKTEQTTSLDKNNYILYRDSGDTFLKAYKLVLGTATESLPNIVIPNDYDAGTNAKYWQLAGSGGGGGGIDPSAIVNDFSTDPADATKVAGANAVFTLFQLLLSDDVNYDTLQEVVDFIKTIDTDGELVSVIDTSVGNTEWRQGITPTVDATYTNLGATPSFDLSTADVFKRTMNVNVTNITFTNGIEGEVYKLQIKVDATGGYTFGYTNTNLVTASGVPFIMPSDPDVRHDYYIEPQEGGKYKIYPDYEIA